jgi:hypothetical protein
MYQISTEFFYAQILRIAHSFTDQGTTIYGSYLEVAGMNPGYSDCVSPLQADVGMVR